MDNKKLINTFVNCSKKFLSKQEITPTPNWVEEYKIKGEHELIIKIDSLNSELKKIDEAKLEIQNEKNSLTKYKSLLY